MESINTKKAPAAVGPYVQGMVHDGLIFTSGQLPINPENGELVMDIEAAAKQSLTNVLEIVKEAGGKLENIIKVNIYVKDMNDFGKVNKVYEEFFGSHKPARSCVEVARLPKDGVIEIEAIAYK
ncbi:2-iminobutanoate/2-iminopropanoate deaminase [Ezakiella coagulans]|mgnify:FL=1|uniref:2-iminobutanoate/2-iminopropanoate deaminase n=1 Tax=Ezakiella coagulans TaxID=46507 RepID=A0A2U1E4M1_9FIRM|nr:RidA family protein [Ezakiella coagulans]KGF07629.1 endoribonuclease L-PSP [Tissierellia bacterium S7-1-4]PVY94898.1 2-iminobutanoate/2-iminopropanoate deaminase [Ezakiella coagulans]UQK61088.1 RidA family protein [Ezakiella coagulans]